MISFSVLGRMRFLQGQKEEKQKVGGPAKVDVKRRFSAVTTQ